ncbi:MAG: diacylglycerol kinase, partial [Limnobacter sp.]|nr:diacylglycerol kinase [Limnobacter sp.]
PLILEDREQYKQQYGRSRLVALFSGLVSLFRHRHQLHITIEHAGGQETLKTPSLFIGNNRLQMEQIGIPFADKVGSTCLAAIAVQPVTTLALYAMAFKGALARLGADEHVRHFPFQRLVVQSPVSRRGKTAFFKVAMDGEIFKMRAPLEFRVSEQPLWLMKLPAERAHKTETMKTPSTSMA